jgi:peptidoglycan/xylan/chitin deacetylase (PgdA/CDA1 family)
MKRLVLTFDDGPNPLYTGKVLDILKENQIKASFFVVAQDAIRSPELIKRMKEEGHCVGLHSLEHRHAFLCGYHYMKHDFAKSMELLQSINCHIHFYRPPWGVRNLFSKRFINKYNLHLVLWDVMAQDWKASSTPEMIADKIEKRIFDNAIICLHDSGDKYGGAKGAPLHTIEALKKVLPKLKEKGYEFVTVEEFYKNERSGNENKKTNY